MDLAAGALRGRLESFGARLFQHQSWAAGAWRRSSRRWAFRRATLYSGTTFTVELLGGIGILLGLFTRVAAGAVAIEMLVLLFTYWHAGFGWLRGGYEYVLLWGMLSFAIALRGGGPYSLDRKLGFEL